MNNQNSTEEPADDGSATNSSDVPLTRRTILQGAGAVGLSSALFATVPEDVAAHEPADGSHLLQTPPMGWNSWNTFACDINEGVIEETADALVESGMKDVGYEYLNIDDCWMAPERDEDGNWQPDPESFPNGISPLADYAHDHGLKLGIYSSAGTVTCQGLPASLEHEEQDAQAMAEWGVDYLKYDNCGDHLGYDPQTRYTRMWDALEATDRDIVKSQCSWGSYDEWTWAPDIGSNLWRTTGDITDDWGRIMSILDQQVGLAQYAGPGHWNDPDMLEVGNAGLSEAESRAHFSLWCILAAPLIAGNDVREMSDSTREILTNEGVIAVNQDPAGIQGTRRVKNGDTEGWAKPLENGDVAVCLLNRGEGTASITASAAALGLPDAEAYVLDDLWANTEEGAVGTIGSSVDSHDVAMYRVSESTLEAAPDTLKFLLETDSSDSSLRGESQDITVSYSNAGTVTVSDVSFEVTTPSGWDSTIPDPDSATLEPGDSNEFTFGLTVPDDAEFGPHEFSVSASYTGENSETGSLSVTGSLRVDPRDDRSVFLSDLEWDSATTGYGEIGLGESIDDNPLTIGGQTFEKGIGTHAESKIVYTLDENYSTFLTYVGVDDEVGSSGDGVTFRIVADGEEIYSSGLVTPSDDPILVTEAVSGVQQLTLLVGTGDGKDYDHADWAGARLLRSVGFGVTVLDDTFVPGEATSLETSVTNFGSETVSNATVRLKAPDGWSTTATSGRTFQSIGVSESVTTAWEVAVPADATVEEYDQPLTAEVTYSLRGTERTLTRSIETTPPSVAPPFETFASTDASFGQLNGTYIIDSNGQDAWQGVDEYGTIYLDDAVGERATVLTKVRSQEDTNAYAKTGIVVRNDLTGAGESTGYVILVVTAEHGFSLEYDSGDGNGFLDTPDGGAVNMTGETAYPCWLRLEKDGTTFSGYYSTDDGKTWTLVDEFTVPSANDVQDAGMFVTSHSTGTRSRVIFDAFDASIAESPPSVVGDSKPTDPNGDGHYEDVDGDGEVTDADGNALFEHFEDPEVQNHPEAYDFNDNDRLDLDDIVEWRTEKDN